MYGTRDGFEPRVNFFELEQSGHKMFHLALSLTLIEILCGLLFHPSSKPKQDGSLSFLNLVKSFTKALIEFVCWPMHSTFHGQASIPDFLDSWEAKRLPEMKFQNIMIPKETTPIYT